MRKRELDSAKAEAISVFRGRAVSAVAAKGVSARRELNAYLMRSTRKELDRNQRFSIKAFENGIFEQGFLNAVSLAVDNKGFSALAIVKKQVAKTVGVLFYISNA